MVILSAIFYLLAMSTNFLEEQGALFGHLVSRFSTHPENLATEALAFIVNRSATMREELRNLFGRTGIDHHLQDSSLRRETSKGTSPT